MESLLDSRHCAKPDEETEAEKGQEPCPWSHTAGCQGLGPGSVSRCLPLSARASPFIAPFGFG